VLFHGVQIFVKTVRSSEQLRYTVHWLITQTLPDSFRLDANQLHPQISSSPINAIEKSVTCFRVENRTDQLLWFVHDCLLILNNNKQWWAPITSAEVVNYIVNYFLYQK